MRKDTILEDILKTRGWRLHCKYYDDRTTHKTYCWTYIFIHSKDKNHPFNQITFNLKYRPTIQLSVKRDKIKWWYLENTSDNNFANILWGFNLTYMVEYYNALLKEIEIIKNTYYTITGQTLNIEHTDKHILSVD